MFGFPVRVTLDDGRVVIMRALVEDEMSSISTAISRYEICKHLSLRGSQSIEQELEWLRNKYTESNSFSWGVCLPQGEDDKLGLPIGTSGVFGINNNRGESGVVLWDTSQWGSGIATAIHKTRCWYTVNIHHLVAIDSGADHVNVGSIRALESVGYVRVGMDYNRGYADGNICHGVKMLWVNPIEHVWNYFWADSEPPDEFLEGRKRAIVALEWAAEHVELL